MVSAPAESEFESAGSADEERRQQSDPPMQPLTGYLRLVFYV